jgi:hypothetical protein
MARPLLSLDVDGVLCPTEDPETDAELGAAAARMRRRLAAKS